MQIVRVENAPELEGETVAVGGLKSRRGRLMGINIDTGVGGSGGAAFFDFVRGRWEEVLGVFETEEQWREGL